MEHYHNDDGDDAHCVHVQDHLFEDEIVYPGYWDVWGEGRANLVNFMVFFSLLNTRVLVPPSQQN